MNGEISSDFSSVNLRNRTWKDIFDFPSAIRFTPWLKYILFCDKTL